MRSGIRLATIMLAGVLIALTGNAPVASAESPAESQWSVTTLDGRPAATSTLLADELLIPGESLDAAFLVHTDRDIGGPLQLRAQALSPRNQLENHISIQLESSTKTVSMPLTEFLRDNEAVTLLSAVPSGTERINIKVALPADSPQGVQRQRVKFQLIISLYGQEIVIPTSQPSEESDDENNSENIPDIEGLPDTGANISGYLVAAAILAGAGLAIIEANRRRSTIGVWAKVRQFRPEGFIDD